MSRDRSPEAALQELSRLRTYRERKPWDTSIGGTLERMEQRAGRAHRRLGDIIDVWNRVVPAELAEQTAITALRGGQLHVAVETASMQYELDRALRSGLLEALRAEHRGPLQRVRVRLDPGAFPSTEDTRRTPPRSTSR